ncbi:serine protease ami-like [Pseudophryne corroboree]|uniref:serine protease ami-like n=1 Tax=Pseudophryne corroboree TaxID=495146 RepID=UPI00308203D6
MTATYLLSALVVVLCITSNDCRPRGRILGGEESALHSRPYMVSLQVNGTHQCGGLLISDEWVLSAAHCAIDSNNNTRAVVGTNSLSESSKFAYDIEMQVTHPLYNRTTRHNDLLLLKVKPKVPLSNTVEPLQFQTEDIVIPGGTKCRVAGWGKITRTGRRPVMLHEVMVPIISNEICNGRAYYQDKITSNLMCAGEGKKDSCDGDSGGPLVCDGVAEGIVSTGFSVCGNAKRPGIYTRIFPYKDWIYNTMLNATLPRTAEATAVLSNGASRKNVLQANENGGVIHI